MTRATSLVLAQEDTPFDSGCHLLGTGPAARLEARLCGLLGMQYALCVANATLGLLAASMAMRLTRREVVVPALAHGGSLAALLHLGARLRVADVDPDTLTIDVDSARRAITSRTVAVLAVDAFGIPSNTSRLRDLANERGLFYLADAAQAFGATRGDRPASCDAGAVVLSFTTGKVLDVGEGGAVLTNRRDIYERVVWHTQHPYRQRRDLGLHLANPFALNARMHPMAALLAVRRLDDALHRLAEHQQGIDRVRRIIEAAGAGTCLPTDCHEIRPAYFRLPIRIDARWQADEVAKLLRNEGFDAGIEPEPPRPFFEHPVFMARYRRRIVGAPACPVAGECQVQVMNIRAAHAEPQSGGRRRVRSRGWQVSRKNL